MIFGCWVVAILNNHTFNEELIIQLQSINKILIIIPTAIDEQLLNANYALSYLCILVQLNKSLFFIMVSLNFGTESYSTFDVENTKCTFCFIAFMDLNFYIVNNFSEQTLKNNFMEV